MSPTMWILKQILSAKNLGRFSGLSRSLEAALLRLAGWLGEWEGEAFGSQETNFWRQRMILAARMGRIKEALTKNERTNGG